MLGAKATKIYRRLGIESKVAAASPHGLIAILYTALTEQLTLAVACAAAGQHEACRKALSKSISLIGGLAEVLDFDVDSELPYNLERLYTYMQGQLLQCLAKFDPLICLQVIELVRPLAAAWSEIDPQKTA